MAAGLLLLAAPAFAKSRAARHHEGTQTRPQPVTPSQNQPSGISKSSISPSAGVTSATADDDSDDLVANEMEERKHPPTDRHRDPDDCDFHYNGTGRNPVKNRDRGVGHKYQKVNDGKPITVAQWFALLEGLKAKTPLASKFPEGHAVHGVEDKLVAVQGYLQVVHFMRTGDHDIHAEMTEGPEWDSPHMIIEIPGGREYCEARKNLWNLARRDAEKRGKRAHDTHFFKDPPQINARGYVFMDAGHAGVCDKRDYWVCNGKRALHNDSHPPRVKGLWEIHPVLSIEAVP